MASPDTGVPPNGGSPWETEGRKPKKSVRAEEETVSADGWETLALQYAVDGAYAFGEKPEAAERTAWIGVLDDRGAGDSKDAASKAAAGSLAGEMVDGGAVDEVGSLAASNIASGSG